MVEVCSGINYDKSPCQRPVVDGEKYCIFHHPEKTDAMKRIFPELLAKEITQQKHDHPDYIDFTGFHFTGSTVFDMDFPRAYFMNSCFHGDLLFRKKDGGNVVFTSEVDMSQMIVEGKADFRGAVFKKHLEAFDVIFEKKACFNNVVFDSVEFAYAHFDGEADFTGARFRSVAIFWHSTFKGKTNFDDTFFAKGGVFPDVWCTDVISFRNTKMDYHLDFIDSRCEKGIVIDDEKLLRLHW